MRAPVTLAKLRAAVGEPWREKVLADLTNKQANAVNHADMVALASRLGCTVKQIQAVASVESAGGGFERSGRPKILFERHIFHRLTSGRHSVTHFSNPKHGGYSEDSWKKLLDACAIDPDAAFASASWGKFQVLGKHWKKLGYISSYAMAWTAAQSEGDHYEMLARYIEVFGLKDELRALSSNPETCRAFASGYNGTAYERNKYHEKLARAMR